MDMFIDKHGLKEGNPNKVWSTSKVAAKSCKHSFIMFFYQRRGVCQTMRMHKNHMYAISFTQKVQCSENVSDHVNGVSEESLHCNTGIRRDLYVLLLTQSSVV